MLSFASVNAVLFTPALPEIADFFHLSEEITQLTVSLFLIGYALGQLLYGPMTSRFGKKPTLIMGVVLQIVASATCLLSGLIHYFPLLVLSRFLVALGAGVGLKMTFTLVNEYYEPKIASQKISYLMLTFAITPGLGVALGGILAQYYGWMSCFIAGSLYGVILLWFIYKLPNFNEPLQEKALQWKHLQSAYKTQFTNYTLLLGGLLMGASTCFVYVFSAIAPFIAINMMGMASSAYGLANIIPCIGLIVGSLLSAHGAKKYALDTLIKVGVIISVIGSCAMIIAIQMALPAWISLFIPMLIIYSGLSFILANASVIAMSKVKDKAHGSAVMSFINMGLATAVVLSLGCFELRASLLPLIFLALCAAMAAFYYGLIKKSQKN